MHDKPVSFLVVLGEQIDGDSWFIWWFHHLPGPSICRKRTPMCTISPNRDAVISQKVFIVGLVRDAK